MADNLSNTNGRVREWIGPRIIPVFADEVQWDEGTNYEPLMMVQNAGETFMSRQYVPAGAPLPDTSSGVESTDYWVHMSNWNAQVEGYREEVLRYAETVLGFSGDITQLQGVLPVTDFDSTNTVKAAINAINTAISTITANGWVTETRISDSAVTTAKIADSNVTTAKIADNAITSAKIADNSIAYADLDASLKNEIKNRNFILLGDSFGKGIYPDPNNPGSYLNTSDGWLNYSKTVIEAHTNHTVITNQSVVQPGNHGFASSARFIDTLQTIAGNMTADEKLKITDIVVLAGTNDIPQPSSDVGTAVINFTTYALNEFPNCTLRIGCLGTNMSGLRTIADQYRKTTAYGGVFISSTIGLLSLRSLVSSDNVHLTESGYGKVARYILNTVLSGHCQFNWREHIDFATDAITQSDYVLNNFAMYFEADQNGVHLYTRPTATNPTTRITDNSGSNASKTLNLNFTKPITLPRDYDVINHNIHFKYNETRIAGITALDILINSRGTIYTTPDGVNFSLTEINGYTQNNSREWLIDMNVFFMPWLNPS